MTLTLRHNVYIQWLQLSYHICTKIILQKEGIDLQLNPYFWGKHHNFILNTNRGGTEGRRKKGRGGEGRGGGKPAQKPGSKKSRCVFMPRRTAGGISKGRLRQWDPTPRGICPIRVCERGDTVKFSSPGKNTKAWKTSDNTSVGGFVKVLTPNQF